MTSSCSTTCPPGTRTRCPPGRPSAPARSGRPRGRCSRPGSTRGCTRPPSRWRPGRSVTREGGAFRLVGDDYPTPDGTCIRDYIHVSDLARAHLLALDACAPGSHAVYNLGSGTGYSNREVLDACREVTGLDIPVRVVPRRPGDPAVLVASSEAIAAPPGWPARRDLHTMVADAWTFAQLTAGARG